MRNWKTITIAVALCLTAATAVAFAAYTPAPGSASPALAEVQQAARITHMASHMDALHTRVAQSCIAHGSTCTLGGTPCCNSGDTCKGPFPNTTCQ
jgi:hypothetical protein